METKVRENNPKSIYKRKKMLALGNQVVEMIKELSQRLDINENAVVSIAVFEFYNKNIMRENSLR